MVLLLHGVLLPCGTFEGSFYPFSMSQEAEEYREVFSLSMNATAQFIKCGCSEAVDGPGCEQGKIARGGARQTNALSLVSKRGKYLQLLRRDLATVVPAKFTKVDHGLFKSSRRGDLDRLPVAKSSLTANGRERPFPGRKRD